MVSLATPAVITTSGFGGIASTTFSADFGPFRVCFNAGDKQECTDLDGDCDFKVIGFDVPAVDNCRQWNASRAFLIVAALAAGIGFICQLMIACSRVDGKNVRRIAGGLGLIAGLAGLISMALFAYTRDHDDTFTSANKAQFGYGFWIIIGGWVLAVFASLPFLRKK